MDIALEQPVLSPIVEKSRTRSPSPKETRRVRKASSDSENGYKEKFQKAQNYKRKVPSPSRDRSEETTKRSKSKKKHKVHNIYVFISFWDLGSFTKYVDKKKI